MTTTAGMNTARRLNTRISATGEINGATYLVLQHQDTTSGDWEIYKVTDGMETFLGYLSSAPDSSFDALNDLAVKALDKAGRAYWAKRMALLDKAGRAYWAKRNS